MYVAYSIVSATNGRVIFTTLSEGQAVSRWDPGTWLGSGRGLTKVAAKDNAEDNGIKQYEQYVSHNGKYRGTGIIG